EGKEYAIAENQQDRGGGGRPPRQQPVPEHQRHESRGEQDVIQPREPQPGTGETLVRHRGRSLPGNSKLVKKLARRPGARPTLRRDAPGARGRGAAGSTPARRAAAPAAPRTPPPTGPTAAIRSATAGPVASAPRNLPR